MAAKAKVIQHRASLGSEFVVRGLFLSNSRVHQECDDDHHVATCCRSMCQVHNLEAFDFRKRFEGRPVFACIGLNANQRLFFHKVAKIVSSDARGFGDNSQSSVADAKPESIGNAPPHVRVTLGR